MHNRGTAAVIALMRYIPSVCALLCSTFAYAADISVEALGPGEPFMVFVQGELIGADGDQFQTKVNSISNAIVGFNSDGGSVVAGIQIGELIRLRNFSTVVADNSRCASACALAWLGGTKRFMGPSARIGFHAAYNAQSGLETGVGNALVGAYLNKIGLPYSAVIYITQAAPDAMTWLRVSDAAQRGISVNLIDVPFPSRSPVSPIPNDRLKIAKSTDAWLRSLETPRSTANADGNSSLTDDASRGADDYASRGARAFVLEIFQVWSQPDFDLNRDLRSRYADEVMYYGSMKSKQAVLADKLKFISRWPERRYVLRPSSLSAQCKLDPLDHRRSEGDGRVGALASAATCTVLGVVDWQARSQGRSAESSGVASVSYTVGARGNSFVIIAESSSILRGVPSEMTAPAQPLNLAPK